jgi:hypothetical protein
LLDDLSLPASIDDLPGALGVFDRVSGQQAPTDRLDPATAGGVRSRIPMSVSCTDLARSSMPGRAGRLISTMAKPRLSTAELAVRLAVAKKYRQDASSRS